MHAKKLKALILVLGLLQVVGTVKCVYRLVVTFKYTSRCEQRLLLYLKWMECPMGKRLSIKPYNDSANII